MFRMYRVACIQEFWGKLEKTRKKEHSQEDVSHMAYVSDTKKNTYMRLSGGILGGQFVVAIDCHMFSCKKEMRFIRSPN